MTDTHGKRAATGVRRQPLAPARPVREKFWRNEKRWSTEQVVWAVIEHSVSRIAFCRIVKEDLWSTERREMSGIYR
jgi:hypothetical protein